MRVQVQVLESELEIFAQTIVKDLDLTYSHLTRQKQLEFWRRNACCVESSMPAVNSTRFGAETLAAQSLGQPATAQNCPVYYDFFGAKIQAITVQLNDYKADQDPHLEFGHGLTQFTLTCYLVINRKPYE